VSLEDFNRGLDDAYNYTFRDKYMNNSDYIEGLNMGEDINARWEQKERDRQEEEYYYRGMQEEYNNYCDSEYLSYLTDLNTELLEYGFEAFEIREFESAGSIKF